MCENNLNGTVNECQDVKVTPANITVEDAKQGYINSLNADIEKLQADFETEKRNGERFQQLYQVCLAYIMLALKNNNLNDLAGVTKKLAEIEAKA